MHTDAAQKLFSNQRGPPRRAPEELEKKKAVGGQAGTAPAGRGGAERSERARPGRKQRMHAPGFISSESLQPAPFSWRTVRHQAGRCGLGEHWPGAPCAAAT